MARMGELKNGKRQLTGATDQVLDYYFVVGIVSGEATCTNVGTRNVPSQEDLDWCTHNPP